MKSEMLDSLQDIIIIEYSNLKRIIMFSISFILAIIFIILVSRDFYILIMFVSAFCVMLILPIFLVGLQTAKIIISNQKIELYIQKRIYFDVFWSNLDTINVIQEKISSPISKLSISYNHYVIRFSLEFIIRPNLKKTLRLWCCPFSKVKEQLILKAIKDFSSKHSQIRINEKISEAGVLYRANICKEIDKFRRSGKTIDKEKMKNPKKTIFLYLLLMIIGFPIISLSIFVLKIIPINIGFLAIILYIFLIIIFLIRKRHHFYD